MADVAIIMGSDSDWRIMKQAAEVLDDFGISYDAAVKSAHRMPFEMLEFAKTAQDKGYKIIIAGAGGAAHLPGMVAAASSLPVIGVPVSLKNLDGLDSLLSIVQMPSGVPVATMAIDGAKNAGIFAARILGTYDLELRSKIDKYRQDLNDLAKAKGEKLKQEVQNA
ncbi:MAG: 5-(carboxyamino)imidazole ribonucleotide mutase [Candidatus Ancillula sp.]|jgi:5-(carboxyamino)imidazole ribonucleotide mutase|nr:5-(carboxyamino)imidazole ribonucleotide mutase [Candidatus Ancillula sp.]